MANTTRATLPVSGGSLAVETHSGETQPVLAIHGLTSNRRLWNWVRTDNPDLSLISPDLRGRADSVDVTGPSSIEQHVADMIAVLDHAGLQRATVCGMSMGAFVAAALAASHPDRVRDLVLVDGGFPMSTHEMTAEQVRATFAEQANRSQHRLPTVADYAEHFLAGAPLLNGDDPLLLDYLSHDLLDGHVRLNPETVVSDAVDTLLGSPRWPEISCPTRLVFAEWGTGEGSAPAYSPEDVAGFAAELPELEHTELVPGTDHAATVMTSRGAGVVAGNIRAALGR